MPSYSSFPISVIYIYRCKQYESKWKERDIYTQQTSSESQVHTQLVENQLVFLSFFYLIWSADPLVGLKWTQLWV